MIFALKRILEQGKIPLDVLEYSLKYIDLFTIILINKFVFIFSMGDCDKKVSKYYKANSGRINAKLKLTIDPKDFLCADFKFFTDPVFLGDKEGFSVRVCYVNNNFDDIFNRVKAAEKGIERLLAKPTDHSWDWTSATSVVSCILDLEKQASLWYEKLY